MSSIHDLIKKLCPSGIPFRELGSFSEHETSRNSDEHCDIAYSITKAGLMPTNEYFKDAKVTSEDTSGYRIVKKNWFVYSPSRIDVGSINFLRDREEVIVSPLNVVFSIDENIILPEYLLAYLNSREGTWQILTSREGIEGTGRKLLPYEKFAKIRVPVPPIDIQSEINSRLSVFEDYSKALCEELDNRKRQFEYYRDELLRFDDTVPRKKLKDTCFMKAGKSIPSEKISDHESEDTPFKCYGGNGIRGFVSEPNQHGEYPLIGRQGALCGNVNYASGDFYATEHAVVVKSKGDYLQRFLYHMLTHMNLNQYRSAGAQPGLAVKNIQELTAPVPSITTQERIIMVLDNFELLCTDSVNGLPAEIEARQLQYRHYRDQLLTFKELV